MNETSLFTSFRSNIFKLETFEWKIWIFKYIELGFLKLFHLIEEYYEVVLFNWEILKNKEKK